MLQQIRAAITANGGTPQSFTEVGALRELVTLYSKTPTKWTRNDLLREAIEALAGTPTKWTTSELLAELVTTLGGTPGFGRNDNLDYISSAAVFSPASLFASGEQGAWYDPSDLATMYQDSAGITPAEVGQPVGRIEDKSGNGNHATQSTAGSRPILRQDASGNNYLDFDGTDDILSTAAINFTASDEMSIFLGLSKDTDAAVGVLLELSATIAANNGTFQINAPGATATANYTFRAKGTSFPTLTLLGAAPEKAVLSATADISAPDIIFRRNGTPVTTTTSMGTGNFGNHPLFIGARSGSVAPFNGRLYSTIIRGALTSGDLLTDAEGWVGARTLD